MPNDTDKKLAGAKKALESANKFTSSVTGGSPNAFSYTQAHQVRQTSGAAPAGARRTTPADEKEFMGIRNTEAPELNTALQTREDAKKALAK